MTRIVHPRSGGSLPGTLHVPIGSSRIATRILSGAAAATLLMLVASPLPGYVLWPCVALALTLAVRAMVASEDFEIRDLILDSGGNWSVGVVPQQLRPARLLTPSLVLPWISVLRFEIASRRQTVMLLPDSASTAALRRLRVRMLLERKGTAA